MNVTHRILDRAEAELHAGRLWRSKEILRGAIAAGHADSTLLERYGQLLETLGDRYEAGRYLFASGVRQPQYEDAIRLFLERCARATPTEFVRQMPASVRNTAFARLPPALQDDLRARGVLPELFDPRTSHHRSTVMPSPAAFGATAAGIFVLLSLLVGAITIVRWVFGLFR